MRTRMALLFLLCSCGANVAIAQTKLPPETRNAALRYWLAFAELKDPPADKDLQEQMQKTIHGDIPWDEQKLGRIIDINESALGIFDRASKLPDCDWGLEYRRNTSASIAYVPRARVLARLNTLRGVREMAKGNRTGAVTAWLEGIHFADQLTHGGTLIFGLIAKENMIPDLQWLTTAVRQGKLKVSERQMVEAALKILPEDGVDWGAIWGIEAATLDAFLEEFRNNPNAVLEYQAETGEAPVKGCTPPSQQEIKAFREYMSQAQSSLHLPTQECKSRLEQLEPLRKRLCLSEQYVIPNAQKLNENREQLKAAKDALQLALR